MLRRRCGTVAGQFLFNTERTVLQMTVDELASKLERVHVLADLLLTILVDNPQAQVLSEIIIEASTLPED